MKYRNIFVIIIIIVSFYSCTKNYGVNKKDPILKELVAKYNSWPSYYSIKSQIKNDYEFETILFLEHEKSKPFLIELKHMEVSSSEFKSIIKITDWCPAENKTILLDKIKLDHYTKKTIFKKRKLLKAESIKISAHRKNDKGEILELPEDEDDFMIISGDDYAGMTYIKTYMKQLTNKKLDEYIYMEFFIEDRKYKLEYVFPIEYKTESTFIDVIRFVIENPEAF